ncbi:MAG TPA: radical SAM protein [Tepidisphaeraceae bacterium]|jgi:cyclic dehypoxanthinyl futalosine synthase
MRRLSFNIDPVLEGRARLTDAQALELHANASLQDLGDWATTVTKRLHPTVDRTYVIDRNINYTNVCTAKCTFCAFRRDHEDEDSYTLTFDQIGEKIEELIAIGGTQILMQGGMNDRLPIEWYEDLLRFIKTKYPSVHIHAFSPPEFVEFERFFGLDVRDIIRRFKAAGLSTIPGGGGEIFAPRVRRRIGIGKCSGDDWLRVMRVAHEEGLNTSATMLIGHIEFVRERIEHMAAIRDMQDYTLWLLKDDTYEERAGFIPDVDLDAIRTRWPGVFAKSVIDPNQLHRESARGQRTFGHYTAFIHWPFQRENTPLGRAKEWNEATYGPFDESTNDDVLRGRVVRSAGAESYLRTLAIARLFLDNVPSLQSSWVTMGPKVGQLALFYGANDMGGAMMEENVVSAAGTTYRLAVRELCRLIRDAGYTPAQRDQYYHLLKRHDGPDAPDLQPDPNPPLRDVEQIDKTFIGRAPGMEPIFAAMHNGQRDDADRSPTVALTVLGGDRP